MAKLRIFISSTYYDLKHIRTNLESFISEMGYESILFESGDIPFHDNLPLDESCYKEIENAHMQVLIIGGRYGSPTSSTNKTKITEKEKSKQYQQYNSITKQEYTVAREKGIPIFIFVEKGVYSEYQTYKQNKTNETIKYFHADSVNIFKLLDEILVLRTGNYIKDFEKFDEIKSWLKDQWAGIFTSLLADKKPQLQLKNLASEISELKSTNHALKEYTEALMRTVKPDNFIKIIEEEERKISFKSAIRFKKEPMIDYLNKQLIDSDKRMSTKGLYLAFENSDDLEDFLKKIKLSTFKIKKFLNENEGIAERDFNRYKEKYFGDTNEMEEEN